MTGSDAMTREDAGGSTAWRSFIAAVAVVSTLLLLLEVRTQCAHSASIHVSAWHVWDGPRCATVVCSLDQICSLDQTCTWKMALSAVRAVPARAHCSSARCNSKMGSPAHIVALRLWM